MAGRRRVTAAAGRGLAAVVERNIRGLLARREEERARRTLGDRVADRITAFTGSMGFVYVHVVLFGA